MADIHDRISERERGRIAKQIIDSPLWAEAWATLEANLADGWRSSQTGDAERREMIYMQLRAAEVARRNIERIFETGQMAEQQIEAERN